MINMIINAAIRGATAGAAATWVNQKMQPARTTPIWTDQIGNVTLTLVQVAPGTRAYYQLFAISAGAWLQVGMYWLLNRPGSAGSSAGGSGYWISTRCWSLRWAS